MRGKQLRAFFKIFESRNIRIIVFCAFWLLFYVVLYRFYCLYYCVIDRCKSFLEFALFLVVPLLETDGCRL